MSFPKLRWSVIRNIFSLFSLRLCGSNGVLWATSGLRSLVTSPKNFWSVCY